jgi:hypothetical protein
MHLVPVSATTNVPSACQSQRLQQDMFAPAKRNCIENAGGKLSSQQCLAFTALPRCQLSCCQSTYGSVAICASAAAGCAACCTVAHDAAWLTMARICMQHV